MPARKEVTPTVMEKGKDMTGTSSWAGWAGAMLVSETESSSSCSLHDDDDSSSAASRRRGVSFGSVNIIEHSLTLGDNPCVSSGLPVALGERQGAYTVAVDFFEAFERKSTRTASKYPKAISEEERERIAVDGGFQANTMAQVKRQIEEIQCSRYQTLLDVKRAKRTQHYKKSVPLVPTSRSYTAPMFIRWTKQAYSGSAGGTHPPSNPPAPVVWSDC